jgi:hypothetical protein
VEIALLKAATFPRLREIEKAMSGAAGVTAPATQRTGEAVRSTSKSGDLDAFLEQVQKARPRIAGHLSSANGRREGNKLLFTFNDTYSADVVTDAREALERIATEVFGAPMTIVVQSEAKAAAPPKEQTQIREDPVLKAFQKHLGGEVVESRRSK